MDVGKVGIHVDLLAVAKTVQMSFNFMEAMTSIQL